MLHPSRTDNLMAMAARLKLLRHTCASKSKLLRDLDFSSQLWSGYEAGSRRISLDHALRLKDTTGVTLDWIFRGDTAGMPYGLMLQLREAESMGREHAES